MDDMLKCFYSRTGLGGSDCDNPWFHVDFSMKPTPQFTEHGKLNIEICFGKVSVRL